MLNAHTLNTILAPINTALPTPIDPELDTFVKSVLMLSEAGQLESVIANARKAHTVPAKPVVSKSADRKVMPTLPTDHAFIRMVACELAIMDAYGDDSPVDGYSDISLVPTIADVNARYAELRPYAIAVDGLEFGRNSELYAEAKALIA